MLKTSIQSLLRRKEEESQFYCNMLDKTQRILLSTGS